MKLLIPLSFALIVCGCQQPSTSFPTASHTPPSRSRELQTVQLHEKLKAITMVDGISEPEAELVAECYFRQNVGCGVFTGIRDGGGYWVVDGAFGYAAMPIEGFHIDKITGRISSPIGPSYANPFQIFPQIDSLP